MTSQAITAQDDNSVEIPELPIEEFAFRFRLPDDVRDGLTNHFLALMGAEPLRPEERLAA